MAAHHAKVLKTGTPAEWVDEAQLQKDVHDFCTWASAHIPSIPDFVCPQQFKDMGIKYLALLHDLTDDDLFRQAMVAALNTATGATPPAP